MLALGSPHEARPANTMEVFKNGLFVSRRVGDFPFRDGPIVEVTADETVDSAFRKLVEYRILSAPVWDASKGAYLGFFDITDALALIYSVDLLITAIPDSMLKKSTALRLASSGSACPDCTALTVGSVFQDAVGLDGQPGRGQASWNPVTNEAPMAQVIFLLATSTRRVPVIDPQTKRVVKILSQSLVTHVLNESLKELEARNEPLPELFNKTPASSGGFGLRNDIITVSAEDNCARDAFHKIVQHGVSAVAVLDDEGKILSSITTKDVRLFKSMEEAALQRLQAERSKRDGIVQPTHAADDSVDAAADFDSKRNLALMDLDCGDFCSMIELTAANKGITMVPVIVVQADTSIRRMIAKMAQTRKHRVWVVDEFRRPIGVVSVSDICKLLVTDPGKGKDML